MRLAMAVVLGICALSLAAGEFSTGGSDLMKIKGYGIFRFDVWGTEDAEPDNGFATTLDVCWEPAIGDMLAARVDLQGSTASGGTAKLNDAYLDLMPAEGFTIRGGQFVRNYGWGYMESTTALIFPDRPFFTTTGDFGTYGKRDVGAMLIGAFDPVTVDVAYSNGAGINAPEDDSNKQLTVHAAITPTEWATLGGGLASYSAYTDTTGEDSYSSSAFDVYGLVNYPMTETVTLNFTAELLSMGYAGPDVEGMDKTSGGALAVALGANFGVNGALITGIQPAVRFENMSPSTQLPSGSADLVDNQTVIDGCVGLNMGPQNVLQIGMRNYGFEDENIDGYTDFVVNWRMKF